MDKPLRLETLLQRRSQDRLWTKVYPWNWNGCETAGPWMSNVFSWNQYERDWNFSWNQFFCCKSVIR